MLNIRVIVVSLLYCVYLLLLRVYLCLLVTDYYVFYFAC